MIIIKTNLFILIVTFSLGFFFFYFFLGLGIKQNHADVGALNY